MNFQGKKSLQHGMWEWPVRGELWEKGMAKARRVRSTGDVNGLGKESL